jgi:hypothetical protein
LLDVFVPTVCDWPSSVRQKEVPVLVEVELVKSLFAAALLSVPVDLGARWTSEEVEKMIETVNGIGVLLEDMDVTLMSASFASTVWCEM